MESLPGEIFELIFEYITDIPNLLVLRSVNKFFNTFFAPRAFMFTTLANTNPVPPAAIMLASSRLAPFVTDLIIDFRMELDSTDLINPNDTVGPQFIGLSAFPNLEAIDIYFPRISYNPRYRQRVISTVLKAIAAAEVPPVWLGIMNFTCNCLHTDSDWERILSGVLDLQLETDCCPRFLESLLVSVQDRLQSLAVTSKFTDCVFPVDFVFNCLTDLELTEIVFSTPGPKTAETFILSLSSTLREMHLVDCVYHIQPAGTDRRWVNVFQVFKMQLKRLQVFETTAVSYVNSVEVGTDCDADLKALQDLWRSIGHTASNSLQRPWFSSPYHRPEQSTLPHDGDGLLAMWGAEEELRTPLEIILGGHVEIVT